MKDLTVFEESEYCEILPGLSFIEPLVITGKARIEFSRYRFRGIFRLVYENGTARMDFDHSSVFGAVKEEGSIFISGDEISVLDQKRSVLYNGDASRKLIRDAAGADIAPSDIILVLMLRQPRYAEFDSLRASVRKSEWRITGSYGERDVEIFGERDLGPVRLDLCEPGDSWCFSAAYRYGNSGGEVRYPEEIIIAKRDGSVRIDLDIERANESEETIGKF